MHHLVQAGHAVAVGDLARMRKAAAFCDLRKIDDVMPLPFGLCEYTRQGIQKSRLELLPWTPLSIEGAQYMEENRLTLEDMLIDD